MASPKFVKKLQLLFTTGFNSHFLSTAYPHQNKVQETIILNFHFFSEG